ncbi:hypothetical protein HDU67_004898 [Dinochytrium kinnereticum]|nr:hypothetical protein HDU67_004898 [Dinochytrium kinnereticum]
MATTFLAPHQQQRIDDQQPSDLEFYELFLAHIAAKKFTLALEDARSILSFDPNNSLVLEYIPVLKEKIALDIARDAEEANEANQEGEEEGSEEEDDEDDEEEDSDDDDDSEEGEEGDDCSEEEDSDDSNDSSDEETPSAAAL